MSASSMHFRYVVLATANFVAGIFGLLGTSIIGYHFGPGGLGDVALAISLLGYALIVTIDGTQLYAIPKVAAAPDSLEQMVSSVMVVRLCLGLLCYALLLIVAVCLYPDRWSLIALFGLSLLPAALTISWVPQALHASAVFAVTNVATQATSVALLWAALKISGSLPAVAVSKILAEFLVAGGLLWWLRSIGRKMERPLPWKRLGRLALDCLPIAGAQLARGLALGMDLIILAIFVGREEVGYFAAALKIFLFLLGLATAYFVIFLPHIAQQVGNKNMARELGVSIRLVLPVAILAAVAVMLMANPLLSLLFGAPFSASAPTLQLLCLAWLANIVARHYRQVLLARDCRRIDFRISCASCAVHFGARLILIPLFGIEGAAIGMLIGEVFLLIAQGRACRRVLA